MISEVAVGPVSAAASLGLQLVAASLAEAVVAVEIPVVVGTLAAVEILAVVGSSVVVVVAVVGEVVESSAAVLAEVVESSAVVLAEVVGFAAGFAGWRRIL